MSIIKIAQFRDSIDMIMQYNAVAAVGLQIFNILPSSDDGSFLKIFLCFAGD